MTKKEKEMDDTLDNDKKEQLKNMKGEENKRAIIFLMKRNNS